MASMVLVCTILRRSSDKLFAFASLLMLVREGGRCGVSASVTAGGGGAHSNLLLPSLSVVASR